MDIHDFDYLFEDYVGVVLQPDEDFDDISIEAIQESIKANHQPKVGEVWTAKMPYLNFKNGYKESYKNRPVVILKTESGTTFALRISGLKHKTGTRYWIPQDGEKNKQKLRDRYEVELKDWNSSQPVHVSYAVGTDCRFLEQAILDEKIGELSERDLAEVQKRFNNFVEDRETCPFRLMDWMKFVNINKLEDNFDQLPMQNIKSLWKSNQGNFIDICTAVQHVMMTYNRSCITVATEFLQRNGNNHLHFHCIFMGNGDRGHEFRSFRFIPGNPAEGTNDKLGTENREKAAYIESEWLRNHFGFSSNTVVRNYLLTIDDIAFWKTAVEDRVKQSKLIEYLNDEGAISTKSNNSFFFFHMVPKGTDISDGLLSPAAMSKLGMREELKKSLDKYRERMVKGWRIYPGKLPEELSETELIQGLEKFRGNGGSRTIYFFRYPPTKILGKNMSDILKEKDIYRINLNDPKLQDYIERIDWGYYGSHTDNKALTRDYYENISEKEYFSEYNDNPSNGTPLFASIPHIGIVFKDGICPKQFLSLITKSSDVAVESFATEMLPGDTVPGYPTRIFVKDLGDGSYCFDDTQVGMRMRTLNDKENGFTTDNLEANFAAYQPVSIEVLNENVIKEAHQYIDKKLTYADVKKNMEFIYDDDGIANGVYLIDGQKYRVRVETIVKREVNGTSCVFFEKKKEISHYGSMYKLPGGSVEPDKSLAEQAECEVNEEILVKVKNVNYTGKYYIVKYDPKTIPEWHKRILWPIGLKYVGAITFVFTAEYDGPYKKKVAKVDQDSLAQKGDWYPIWEFEELRIDPHQGIALESSHSIEPVKESVFFSDDHIYYQYDEWLKGNIKLLFITGLSGSGKSTLAQKLAKEHRCDYYEIDHEGKKIDKLHPEVADMSKEERRKVRVRGIIDMAVDKDRKCIIEGAQIAFTDPNWYKPYAMIIVGTSLVTSTYRMIKRGFTDREREAKFAGTDDPIKLFCYTLFTGVPHNIKWNKDQYMVQKEFEKHFIQESMEVIEESDNSLIGTKIIPVDLSKYNKPGTRVLCFNPHITKTMAKALGRTAKNAFKSAVFEKEKDRFMTNMAWDGFDLFMQYSKSIMAVDIVSVNEDQCLTTDLEGFPVIACESGKVVHAQDGVGEASIFNRLRDTVGPEGNTVIIAHDNKTVTLYAHLQNNSITVRKGDIVHKGQVIGKVGNTGDCTIPHLHFETSGTTWKDAGIGRQHVGFAPFMCTDIGIIDAFKKSTYDEAYKTPMEINDTGVFGTAFFLTNDSRYVKESAEVVAEGFFSKGKKNIIPLDLDYQLAPGRRILCANTHNINITISTARWFIDYIKEYKKRCVDSFFNIITGIPDFMKFMYKITFHNFNLLKDQIFAVDMFDIDDSPPPWNNITASIEGCPILACNDGKVVAIIHKDKTFEVQSGEFKFPSQYKENIDAFGNAILIEHENGEFYSMYAHILDGSFKVKIGQVIKRGDEIAEVGNTGNSSAAHLHFELFYNTKLAGPMPKQRQNFEPYGKTDIELDDETHKVKTFYDELEIDDSGNLGNWILLTDPPTRYVKEMLDVIEESAKQFKSSKAQNFEDFCKECKTPEDAMNWFIANKVVWNDKANDDKMRWPDTLVKERKGNCLDQSVMMHFFFKKRKIEHRMALFTIRLENGTTAGHIFPLFRRGKYIFAWLYIGPGHGVITGPYHSWYEAAGMVTEFYKVLLLSGSKKGFDSPISDDTEWSVQEYSETEHLDKYLNKDIVQKDYLYGDGGDNLWSTHFFSRDFHFIRIPKVTGVLYKILSWSKQYQTPKQKKVAEQALEYIKESAVPVTEDHPDVINDYAIEDLNESTVKKYKPTYQGLRHIRCGDDYHGKIIIDISEVVGFVNVRKSDGMIQALEVNIEYREHGIGTLLLNIAIKLGATQLTVNVNNEIAHNMYLKNGWKDTKIIGKMQYMTYGTVKEATEEPIDVKNIVPMGICDYVLQYLGNAIDIQKFADIKSGRRFMYTYCTVMKKHIPLILLLAYCEGLTTVLRKAEVNFFFTDTRPRIKEYESVLKGVIPFADGYLVYDKFPLEVSLLMNGLALVDTKGFEYAEMDGKDVYVSLFDILFGTRMLANAFDNFYDWMIDPVTYTVLQDLNYPTDFVGLLLAGNKLLADNNYTDELDMRNYRVRSNEMAYAYAFKKISEAYGKFRMTSNNKNPDKISIPQGSVIKDIMQSQMVEDVSELSPIVEVEKAHTISDKGDTLALYVGDYILESL